MLVGAILAVTQTDIKRLLAYSSIANAGYLLVGVLALGATARARAVHHDVLPGRLRLHGARRVRASSRWSATPTARPPTCPAGPGWAGARRCSPRVFTFLLLAFAGIPLTSGFTSKFAVFGAAIDGGSLAAGRRRRVTSAIARSRTCGSS